MTSRSLLRSSMPLLLTLCLGAQQGLSQSVVSTEAMLRQMTQSAGVVFAGEVISVRRPAGFAGSGQDAAEGVVTVEFRVDDAVRGCTSGSTYTLREWAGLWTGSDRFRAGQRLLVFLHSPGRDGLSSPVSGKAGLVPLRGGGRAPGPYDAEPGASEWLADLRWVRAQASSGSLREEEPVDVSAQPVRPIRGRPREDAEGAASASTLTDPFVPAAGRFAHRMALPQSSDSTTQPLSQVLGLCLGWVRVSDGSL